MCVCMQVCMCVCAHVCVCAHACVCTMYMYMEVHTNVSLRCNRLLNGLQRFCDSLPSDGYILRPIRLQQTWIGSRSSHH